MDEQSLILAAQNGDLDAFNDLVLTYQERVFNLAYRILGNPESAGDAAQNAFIAAYKHIRSYRGGSFRAWLLRIVTNQCYDELRRQKRNPQLALEPTYGEEDEEIESPNWLADTNPLPEQSIDNRDMEKALQHCLEGLPDDFRTVMVMVDVEGLDYKEVSTIIRKPLGTIKSRLARARLRMQDCLQGFWELLPERFRLMGEGKT